MEKLQFIEACREGGARIELALRRLHRDYAGALLREGLACLGDHESAREMVQETLLKAWRRCASFRGDSELFPWLRQLLRHAAIDLLRTRRPETPWDRPDGEPWAEAEDALRELRGDLDGQPESLLHDAQLLACYRACAERFAREQPAAAAVVRWLAEDDLSHEEIGALLQRTPGATREYVSQCRKKARHYFQAWYLMLRERVPT